MKKAILHLIVFSILMCPLLAIADVPIEATPPATGNFRTVLQQIINWALGVLLAFAALMIIIAGYFFVTAQGDAEKVKTARNFVLYALIGVLVGVISWVLVRFAGNIGGLQLE